MIKYVKGDIFDSNADVIAHGVNCAGGFGSGVAGQIAKLYPIVRESYLEKYRDRGWKLGDVQFVHYKYQSVWTSKVIANCATQQEFLPRGQQHADYNAIRSCLKQIKKYAILHKLTVAIPKIGAGLAGGDWNIIEGIVDDVFDDYDVTVYYLEDK